MSDWDLLTWLIFRLSVLVILVIGSFVAMGYTIWSEFEMIAAMIRNDSPFRPLQHVLIGLLSIEVVRRLTERAITQEDPT